MSVVTVSTRPLGEIVSPRNEKVDPQSCGDMSFIGLDDIEAHTMRLIGSKPASELKSSAKRFYPGDVLYSRLRPYLNKVWKANTDGICSSEFIVLPENENIDAKFLSYRLNAYDFVAFANSLNAGDRPRVDFKQISDFELPDFPLEQQKSVVEKIDSLLSELDKGIESLKTAREQLKVYRQAVLKHAFEGKLTAQWREQNKDKLESPEQLLARIQHEREARYQQQLEEWKVAVKAWEGGGKKGKKPGKPQKSKNDFEAFVDEIDVPAEWGSTVLGSLNVDVFDGPFGSNLKSIDYVDQGVRVIRLENVGCMEFINNKYSYVTNEKYEQIKRHTVSGGDIIFSSFITEGIRVVLLPSKIGKAVNKADCFCIRLHGIFYDNEFLAWYLSSRGAYRQVVSEIHGVGRPRINTTQLKCFTVPLCSIDEQQEIVSKIKEMLSEADRMGEALSVEIQRSEALRQAVLEKAFSGQLMRKGGGIEASVLRS